MNLVRRSGSYADGCYATVFFVDDTAIKVFKRRGDVPPNHVRDVFCSEDEAYRYSANRSEICHYTNHFIGVKVVCMIKDETGRDISHEYHPEFAYEMERLAGEPVKVGALDSESAQHIQGLFRSAGVRHMRDCSVFLDQAGELANVIDFAMQEYELQVEDELL
jgi:hypothetical protein